MTPAAFAASPAAVVAAALLLGLVVGSFLNVVIARLPVMLEREWKRDCSELLETSPPADADSTFNLMVPRSRCPHCGHRLTALENIPLLSYAWLKGRCAGCKAPISIQYPLVELTCGLLSAAVAWRFGFSLETASGLVLTWALLALSAIDLHHQLLPDAIVYPLLWLGLLLAVLPVFADLPSSVLGAALGYLSLWSVYHVFRLITGKEGMGYGDFKLLALLGAWLGWQSLPLVILLASFSGAVIGLGLIFLRGHDRAVPIPFGPYLAIGGWVGLLWGTELTALYVAAVPG